MVNDEIADRSGPDADGPPTQETGPLVRAPCGWSGRPVADRAPGEAGRRIAVLDDDPTGSQTVHDVDVVTVFEPDEIAAGLSEAGSTCSS